MSGQIFFNHNINTPAGGFVVVFYFDALDWFEGEGQVPELNYIDLNYDERQTELIKACIESINSPDDTMVCAMQDAADEYKRNMDWEEALDRYN